MNRSSSSFDSDSVGSINQHLNIVSLPSALYLHTDSRGDWPLGCGWVERVILQPLAEIRNLQTRALFKFRKIDKTLVSNSAVRVCESDIVVRSQSLGDIVGVEQSNLRNLCQSLAT